MKTEHFIEQQKSQLKIDIYFCFYLEQSSCVQESSLSFESTFLGLWSQSAYKPTIHSVPCSWIYKPTIPQSPSSHLQDYSICNNARLEFSTSFVQIFDPIEWCLKNGLHSGGSNSQPFTCGSSALTTRPHYSKALNLL